MNFDAHLVLGDTQIRAICNHTDPHLGSLVPLCWIQWGLVKIVAVLKTVDVGRQSRGVIKFIVSYYCN